MSIRVILYVVISLATTSIINKERIEEIQKIVIRCSIGILGFTFIEFIIKNILKSNILNSFISWFFGVGGSTLEVLLERGSIYSLQGLTREPSHLASAMFWLGLIIIFSNYSKRFIWKMLLCVSLFMLISRSFSGILFILALYTIYAIENNKKVYLFPIINYCCSCDITI